MSVKTADVIEVLTKGVAYIDGHGWVQGASERAGRVCARGAVGRVIFDDPMPHGAQGDPGQWDLFDATLEALAITIGGFPPDDMGVDDVVTDFNDSDDRTQKDVTDLFRHAATRLQQEANPS